MKKVAILQSSYIPWKGYFDVIGAVDEFIIYDDAQFTKNDWRNRNQIKTPTGLIWLSVPVGININRRIRDVLISDINWQEKHWKSLVLNYSRSKHFPDVAAWLEPIYLGERHLSLSTLNRKLIESICKFLGISTVIRNSWDYDLCDGKSERLIYLCQQAGAQVYLSGPAAKSYLDEKLFDDAGIKVQWFNYLDYPSYPQMWGEFVHNVSILDLLLTCGEASPGYLKFASDKVRTPTTE